MLSGLFTFFSTKYIYGKCKKRWLMYILEITSEKMKRLDEIVLLGQNIVRTVKSGSRKKTKDSFMANKQQIHTMIACTFSGRSIWVKSILQALSWNTGNESTLKITEVKRMGINNGVATYLSLKATPISDYVIPHRIMDLMFVPMAVLWLAKKRVWTFSKMLWTDTDKDGDFPEKKST